MKEQIIKLHSEGKSYGEIQRILGCSKGTIAFHCGEGQKLKYYQNRQRARAKFRIELRQRFGGKCIQCGYNKCLAALEFHHPNQDKDMDVSRMLNLKGFAACLREASKCLLLCANCHRELHDKEQTQIRA